MASSDSSFGPSVPQVPQRHPLETSNLRVPRGVTHATVAGLLAVLIAGAVTATTIRFATFAQWGTDPAAYVEAAHRWRSGRLFEPSPLALWAGWNKPVLVTAPIGQRPGAVRGTNVTEYPLGLPLLMAAALGVAGEFGPYLIPPLSAGLLVLCTYGIARRLAGPWHALVAAALIGMSPATTGMAVQPMSDVPVTAFWALAWLMALRPGLGACSAAGAAAAMAIMIRPNTAPLAGVVVILVLLGAGGLRNRRAWTAAGLTSGVLSIGVALVLWSQALLFGGPFESGYFEGLSWMFAVEHVPKNLVLIPTFLTMLHGKGVFVGLLTPVLLAWRPNVTTGLPQARMVAWSALAIALVTFLTYLPYFPYQDPVFVRFQLPAITAMFVLMAGLTHALWGVISRRVWPLAPFALIPAIVVVIATGPWLLYPLDIRVGMQRSALLGRYLRETLPANGVIVTQLEGGTMAHFTRLPVVRLDLVSAETFDPVLDDLVKHGYAPFLVLGKSEEEATFAARFPVSRFRELGWPPRARAIDVGTLSVYALADQARFARGERWPVDILRAQ